jgi:hypothetical protein
MADSGPPIRFGIMCRGLHFPAFEAQAIRQLIDSGAVPVLLIRDARTRSPGPAPGLRENLMRRLRDGTLVSRLRDKIRESRTWLWRRLEATTQTRAPALANEDLSELLAAVETIDCMPQLRGRFSQYFDAADVARIRDANCDFILRFGFDIIRGDVLDAARYGVWSYHHDDELVYRGSPPCFWEIYRDDPVTGAVLQRLTDRLDGGVVLWKGFFKTRDCSYVENRNQVLLGSADWPAMVCRDLRNDECARLSAAPSRSDAPIVYDPGNLQMLVFGARILRNRLRRVLRRVYERTCVAQWNIAVVDRPITDFLASAPALPAVPDWLPALPADEFLADGFGMVVDDELHIICEHYAASSRGTIRHLRFGDDPTAAQQLLAADVHLSYPYLVRDQGEIYCIPETHEASEIVLYRAVAFPERWEKVAVLVADLPGNDSTVFRHHNRWWLFTVTIDAGNHRLHLFHADALTGPWQPHAQPYVKLDPRSVRPAGTPFLHNGELYRPTQDCSRSYGGAIVITRIDVLTPTAFAETPVATLAPVAPYSQGLHTLAAVDGRTLIDGKRRQFIGVRQTVTSELPRMLRLGTRRLFGR